MITIIQNKLLTLLVIDTNHQKVDGMLLYNIIDYVTISTQSNAVDFGDLFQSRGFFGGCSNAHGGL